MGVNNLRGNIVKPGSTSFVVVIWIAAGCGGGGDAVPLADLGTEMGGAVCGKMAECCTMAELEEELLGASNQQECEAFYAGFLGQLFVPVLQDSVAAGRLVYDGEAMRACLDAYGALACADLRTALATGPDGACDGAFTGQVALGGACATDLDCVSGFCDGDAVDFEGNVTMGTCIQAPGVGQACADGDCDEGLYCDYAGGAPTCQATLADGSGCGADGDCASGSCNGASGGQGGTCGPSMTCDGM